MESSDAIDGMCADNREKGHPDFLWPALLDQTHSLHLLVVTWVSLPQLCEIHVVDVVDELQVPWQEPADTLLVASALEGQLDGVTASDGFALDGSLDSSAMFYLCLR